MPSVGPPILAAVGVLFLQGTAAQEPSAEAQAVFRADVEIATIRLAVRDPNDHLITSLQSSDFRLLVDGQPTPVTVFSKDRLPLTVVLMIHTLENGEPIERLREVAGHLVEALEPVDKAAIGSFAQEVAVSPFFSSDPRVLHRVLAEELWWGIGNPLGNAIGLALRALSGKVSGRRSVIVLGPDARPGCCEQAALSAALAAGARVSGIALPAYVRNDFQSRSYQAPPADRAVQRLARSTGGAYLKLADRDGLREAMRALLEELRHEYVIGFRPSVRDGQSHAVSVRFPTADLKASILTNAAGGTP